MGAPRHGQRFVVSAEFEGRPWYYAGRGEWVSDPVRAKRYTYRGSAERRAKRHMGKVSEAQA